MTPDSDSLEGHDRVDPLGVVANEGNTAGNWANGLDPAEAQIRQRDAPPSDAMLGNWDRLADNREQPAPDRDQVGVESDLHAVDVDVKASGRGLLVTTVSSAHFSQQQTTRAAAAVAALGARAEQIVIAELDRLAGRVPDLSVRELTEVAGSVWQIVDTLLYVPSIRIEELAGRPGGDRYIEAIQELFELDPPKAQAEGSPGS